MISKELAFTIARLILDKKGSKIIIQDLSKLTTMTDYFVICTVDADVHARAVMDHIKEQLFLLNIKPWHTEGVSNSSWILLDFVDVVVHIFKDETRAYYNLERLWGDAETQEIKDEHDATPAYTK
ncbi:MAG: ribosome silencing factor [Calditrichaeota bacterium]|nr:MAG: ribosome silencing factor [Calditrichota bacterium]